MFLLTPTACLTWWLFCTVLCNTFASQIKSLQELNKYAVKRRYLQRKGDDAQMQIVNNCFVCLETTVASTASDLTGNNAQEVKGLHTRRAFFSLMLRASSFRPSAFRRFACKQALHDAVEVCRKVLCQQLSRSTQYCKLVTALAAHAAYVRCIQQPKPLHRPTKTNGLICANTSKLMLLLVQCALPLHLHWQRCLASA